MFSQLASPVQQLVSPCVVNQHDIKRQEQRHATLLAANAILGVDAIDSARAYVVKQKLA